MNSFRKFSGVSLLNLFARRGAKTLELDVLRGQVNAVEDVLVTVLPSLPYPATDMMSIASQFVAI